MSFLVVNWHQMYLKGLSPDLALHVTYKLWNEFYIKNSMATTPCLVLLSTRLKNLTKF